MSVQARRVTVEPLNLSVTFIRARCRGAAPEQTNIGSATGFFYREGTRTCLITNRHVVFDSEKGFYPDNLQIRVHTSQTSSILNREIALALYDNDQRRLWLEHASPRVDVVAIPIDGHIQARDVIHCFSSADLPPPNIFLDVQDNCMVVE